MQLTVAPGAPFAGQRVRTLGLPPERCVAEHVPTVDTTLPARDRLTAVIATQTAAAARLRDLSR